MLTFFDLVVAVFSEAQRAVEVPPKGPQTDTKAMDQHSWLNPTTAFTVACAAFSALAITTVWRNQHSYQPEKVQDLPTAQPRPQNRRRKAVDSIYAPDYAYAAFRTDTARPPYVQLQELLQNIAQLSKQLRAAQLPSESRLILTSLLGELSLLTTSLYRLQQTTGASNHVFSQDLGRAACFEAAMSSLDDILALLKTELGSSGPSANVLQEALQQLRDQRPALDVLLEDHAEHTMPPTPPSEAFAAETLKAGEASGSLMPSFVPGTGLTPGGDSKAWIEPPPEYSPPASGSTMVAEKNEKGSLEPAPPKSKTAEEEEVYDTDALYNAVTKNDIDLVNEILALEAYPDAAIGELQRTALHQAAHLNHVVCLASLLRHNASKTAEDVKGDTAIHLAAWAGNCEALSTLLAHGVDVDWLSGRDGYSPLWCAISASNIDAARLLLKHGARVSLRADGGQMPLHQAAVTGQSAMCELLLERGAQVDSLDDDLNTALHYAAASGSTASVRALIKGGADVKAVQGQGLTPAHWTAHKGHTEVLGLLLDCGADVDALAEEGATPLHLAANRGHTQAARLLLEKGADRKIEATGWDGVSGTPAEMAKAKGHVRLARMLK
jgi:ankyrin repeat protein